MLCEVFEVGQRSLPQFVEVIPNRGDAEGIELVHVPSSFRSAGNQTRILEDAQMLRDSRSRNRQSQRDLSYRRRAGRQDLKDLPSSGVSKGGNCRGSYDRPILVSDHLR